MTAAAAGLSVAVAAPADPRGMGRREGAGVNVNMRGYDASARGPEVTPRGFMSKKRAPRERSQVWEETSQKRDGRQITDSHARNGCGNVTVRGFMQ
jgi:hypothetical protein